MLKSSQHQCPMTEHYQPVLRGAESSCTVRRNQRETERGKEGDGGRRDIPPEEKGKRTLKKMTMEKCPGLVSLKTVGKKVNCHQYQ